MLLNRQTITAIQRQALVETGPVSIIPEKVIQFGGGNFLRGFADWMFNELNKRELFNGRVIVVKMLPSGNQGRLNQQNGLYTLLTRGIMQGTVEEHAEIITSISREINPYNEWGEFLKCAEIPDLRYVVSNSTEAGIEYVKTDMPFGKCPLSFPAKLTAFLFHRCRHFSSGHERGMVVLPCELIEENGTILKELVLRHASDWKLDSSFTGWINSSCIFFDTLVDRIVPGFPADEVPVLKEALGYEDNLMVATEPYHLWVLEGDSSVARELQFNAAGLNVIWTDDITPYRKLKVRILNGAHTMSALAAFQAGNDTVLDMMNDKLISAYIRRGIFEEIIPALDFPEKEKSDFAQSVLDRFRNPFVRHKLMDISLNSVAKFRVRVLPSLLDYVEKKRRIPQILVFSLASLITFYRCKPETSGNYTGERRGIPYPVRDSQEHLRFFHTQWLTNGTNISCLTKCVLSNEALWGMDLSVVTGLTESISYWVRHILEQGMTVSLRKASSI